MGPEENQHTGRQAEPKNEFLTLFFYGAVAGVGFMALVMPIVFTVYWVLKKQRCLKRPHYYVVRIELIEGFRGNHGNRGTKQRVESHPDKTEGHYATLV